MNTGKRLYLGLIMCWLLCQGILCEHLNEPDNCPVFRSDTTSMPFDVVNQSTTFHLQDTIRLFSRISDSIITRKGESFVTPLNPVFAHIETYRIVPWGASYGLNYANNEFNFFANTGIFQNVALPGYDVLFERNQPFNNLALSVAPGDSGLYLFTVWLQDANYGGTLDFSKGNDLCTDYLGIPVINIQKQNRQYWDSLGITEIGLINSTAPNINKRDENYFFVKVEP